ncbi:unnamed protein product [Microthlaspi erraticum]|uniref:Uncharacterized protein n=1 Tax=Microthlaspi erraticum TaxID=1685480 RepID=A0A6D2J3A4_9BRAS|nr:unnamed protein product [Microthlaspi erraticum]
MEEVARNLDQEAAGDLVAEEEQLEPEEVLEALAIPTGPVTRSQTKLLNLDIGRVLSRLSRQVLEVKHPTLEDEEDSNKSLSEYLLEQIKKLMMDEFDRREQVKEGKRKESRDHIHISDEERRNDPMASRRMADEQANAYYDSGHSSQGSPL